MIVKTAHGYKVTNESGNKNLSQTDLSKAEALKRLKQIEWFKNKN
jgi:hypothetical protein